jgi:hypothetical protein
MQLWVTGLFVAATTLGRPALAAPDAERLKTAAEEFDAGRRAYRLHEFENAAVHFENADRDVPSPEALESAIRARKEAGQDAKAATLGAWAIARYPGDKDLVDYVPKLLSDVDKSLYKLSVTCAPNCALVIDEKVAPFGETAAATVYLEPGSHTLLAGWPNDRRTNSTVDATAGGSGTVSFSAPAAPIASSAPVETTTKPVASEGEASHGSGLPPAVFLTGAVATVVLTGVTIWSGVDTLNNPGTDAIATQCQPRDTNCAAYQLGLSHQRRTNILIGATGVVAAATAVVGLFFTNWGGGGTKASEGSITPLLTAEHGIGVGAVGRF